MALIKGASSDSMTGDVIVLDLGDLRKQADEILRRARAEAQQTIADAKTEAARLRAGAAEQGRAEGFEQGKTEGLAAGRTEGHAQTMAETKQQLTQLQQSWTEAMETWDAERRDLMIDARESLVALSLAVAERIVRRTPEVQPDAVVDQIEAAIDYVVRPSDITIRIHPDDRSIVAEALPAIVESAEQVTHAQLVDDESVGRGGCMVTYGKGRVDATLQTQLDRVIEAMMPCHANQEDAAS